jgi:hypothetical protein
MESVLKLYSPFVGHQFCKEARTVMIVEHGLFHSWRLTERVVAKL